jgi:hypothetical protein
VAALIQRLEGTGEFAYTAPFREREYARNALAELPWLQARQALESKVLETTDEKLQAFYKEALEAWIKKNG